MSMATNSSCQRHANRKWPACREDNLLRQRQRRNLRQSLRKLHPNQHLNKLIFLTWVEDLLQRQHLLRQLRQVVNLNSPLISCKEELKSQLQHRNHRPLISSILASLVRHNLHRLHQQLRQPMSQTYSIQHQLSLHSLLIHHLYNSRQHRHPLRCLPV